MLVQVDVYVLELVVEGQDVPIDFGCRGSLTLRRTGIQCVECVFQFAAAVVQRTGQVFGQPRCGPMPAALAGQVDLPPELLDVVPRVRRQAGPNVLALVAKYVYKGSLKPTKDVPQILSH